jgi:hypothetical protein
MTSETAEVFVWVHLPGQAEPVVCGRFAHRRMADGRALGEFVYGRSYLARTDAVAIDPVALPLRPLPFTPSDLSGGFSVLLDAGPDAWGKRLIDQFHGPQDTLGRPDLPATYAAQFLAMGFGSEGAAVTLENLLSEPQAFDWAADEAADMVRAQWERIRGTVMGQLLAYGCPERLAAAVPAAMPGAAFFGC